MKWQDYEEITKHIYETLGKAHGTKIEGYGKNCKVTGKSGIQHQIDVLTSHSDGVHTYKTMIECKYWTQKVDKDIVMKVAEIVDDANLSKGIIVSRNGFTSDATNYAEHKNIGLVELREPTDKDWKGRIRNIRINLNMMLPTITDFELIIANTTEIPRWLESKLNRNPELFSIRYSDDTTTPLETIFERFNSELSKKERNETLEQNQSFDSNTLLLYNPTNETIPINGIKINGILKIAKQTINLHGDNYILLIMKSIFESKEYSITKNREIKELKKI